MLFFVLYHLYSTRSAFDCWISISGSNLSCLLDLQLFSSHLGGFSCRWFAILARLPCCLPESYKTSVGCGSLALPYDFSASLVHYSGLAPHVVTFLLEGLSLQLWETFFSILGTLTGSFLKSLPFWKGAITWYSLIRCRQYGYLYASDVKNLFTRGPLEIIAPQSFIMAYRQLLW